MMQTGNSTAKNITGAAEDRKTREGRRVTEPGARGPGWRL